MHKNATRKLNILATSVVFITVAALLIGCAAQPAASSASQAAASAATTAAQTTAAATATSSAALSAKVTGVSTAAAALAAAGTYSIALDVNPSIELTVVNGVIAQVSAYNDDGQKLLLNVVVTGMKATDAIEKLLAAMVTEGYLNNAETKPYLLISVTDGQPDPALTDGLKHIAKKALKTLDVKCKIKAASISPDIAAKAEALGISAARYVLFDAIAKKESMTIEQAIAKYGTLKIAELVRLADADDFNDNNDEQDGIALTPEQQVVLDAALVKYNNTVKTAEETYVKAKISAIGNLKTQWEKIKSERKDQGAQKLGQTRKQLMTEYKKLRNQIHDTFKVAVQSAQTEFMAAVAALGLTDKQIEKLLDYRVGNLCDDAEKYIGNENDGKPSVNDNHSADNNDKGDKKKDKDAKGKDDSDKQSADKSEKDDQDDVQQSDAAHDNGDSQQNGHSVDKQKHDNGGDRGKSGGEDRNGKSD